MFRRLLFTSLLATLAIMGSATTASATDLRDSRLPGVDIAARAVDGAAALLYGLSALPGVSIGANATCGAANLLWSLSGRPPSSCGKKPADDLIEGFITFEFDAP
jgi:hypothetical protein